jgi:hypothetical protein
MKPVTVKSFTDANKVLETWRLSAPDYGKGYHKVGFEVMFKSGDTYKGRYDLNKANYRGYADSPTLEKHILAFRKYKAIK